MPNSSPAFEDRVADELALFVRAPDLETRRAGHAVTQRADRLPPMLMASM